MKTISDMDLGINCDMVSKGETDEEVIQVATEHIQESHPEEWGRVMSIINCCIMFL